MIFRPMPAAPGPSVVPVWTVIEAAQRRPAGTFSLITQPEHASLAGDLAARFRRPPFPVPPDEIVRAIAWHDQGWAGFDLPHTGLASPPQRPGGRPRSFIDMEVVEFLVAWKRSIDDCARLSPTGGIIVSAHFCRLARYRLDRIHDTPDDTGRLNSFLRAEDARQSALLPPSGRSAGELRSLTDLLQFCDLLSLYLCCGARDTVEFPQHFGGETVRVRYDGGVYRFAPSPFTAGCDLGANAWSYPGSCPQPLAFLLE